MTQELQGNTARMWYNTNVRIQRNSGASTPLPLNIAKDEFAMPASNSTVTPENKQPKKEKRLPVGEEFTNYVCRQSRRRGRQCLTRCTAAAIRQSRRCGIRFTASQRRGSSLNFVTTPLPKGSGFSGYACACQRPKAQTEALRYRLTARSKPT